MELLLALPGFLERAADTTAPMHAPALATLLANAGDPKREDGGIAAALAARYGVLRQTDWPLAPIRLAALGVDPEAAFWLCADPVTLAVGRNDVRMTGIVADLERSDADLLLATLNAHFAGDGLTFVAPRSDAFFVRAAGVTGILTHPPEAAIGRPLHGLYPDGPDAAAWRRWQSEIEMLLHEHPVNSERERAGQAPANSLWFSCGGTSPPRRAGAHSIRTFATTGMAVALALHAGAPAQPLPGDLAAVLAAAAGADSLVVAFEPAVDPVLLERSWAMPARDALARGSIDAVTLLAEDSGDAVVWRAGRPGLWQRVVDRYRRHDIAALVGRARMGV